jgi:preprotein translocase subunit SecA
MLRIIDAKWMAHLQEMDYLKTGIGLRAIGREFNIKINEAMLGFSVASEGNS